MRPYETRRQPSLNVEKLEARDLPAANISVTSFTTIFNFAADAAKEATAGPSAPPGSLGAVGQAAQAFLIDGVKLTADTTALTVDAAVFATETGLVTASASNPATLVGTLGTIAAYAKTANNSVALAGDAAQLGLKAGAAIQMPNAQTLGDLSVATAIVIGDIAETAVFAVVKDANDVIQDFGKVTQDAVALDNAVQQFGGYTKLLDLGLSSASAFITSSGANALYQAGINQVLNYEQNAFNSLQQSANTLANGLTTAGNAFADFLSQYLQPATPTQTTPFDPDNDGDDDTGLAGY